MMGQSMRDTLSKELEQRKKRNPSYSLRAFSNQLGVGASALSEILNGKRKISRQMCEKITEVLSIDPRTITDLQTPKTKKEKIDFEVFRVIGQWYHFAILSLSDLKDFDGTPGYIAKRLGISTEEATVALERLVETGHLIQDQRGKLTTNETHYETQTDVLDESVRNHTLESLEIAKDSLLNHSLERRDFSTLTLTFEKAKMREAKKMIHQFRKKFEKKVESPDADSVYKLAIQFYPLTQDKDNLL